MVLCRREGWAYDELVAICTVQADLFRMVLEGGLWLTVVAQMGGNCLYNDLLLMIFYDNCQYNYDGQHWNWASGVYRNMPSCYIGTGQCDVHRNILSGYIGTSQCGVHRNMPSSYIGTGQVLCIGICLLATLEQGNVVCIRIYFQATLKQANVVCIGIYFLATLEQGKWCVSEYTFWLHWNRQM